MKLELSINQLLFGLLALVVLIAVFKISRPEIKNERIQRISDYGASTGNVKEIAIIAKKFSFSPNPIRLKTNERVRLKINSTDVTHGFSVPELGIDEIIEPGKETIVDFIPTKAGKFTLLCSIECGTGHTGMRGEIIVE